MFEQESSVFPSDIRLIAKALESQPADERFRFTFPGIEMVDGIPVCSVGIEMNQSRGRWRLIIFYAATRRLVCNKGGQYFLLHKTKTTETFSDHCHAVQKAIDILNSLRFLKYYGKLSLTPPKVDIYPSLQRLLSNCFFKNCCVCLEPTLTETFGGHTLWVACVSKLVHPAGCPIFRRMLEPLFRNEDEDDDDDDSEDDGEAENEEENED